jgi:uncharacterized protein (DUF1697 family)
MARQVALLRGINLGSARRIAMGELRTLLEAHYEEVSTYIASGNILLTSDLPPDALGAELERRIEERFEIEVPVVVRTREELAAVVAGDPFAELVTDPKRYQVSFLGEPPDRAITSRIEAAAVAPEAVAVKGREIFAWHPHGVIRSPLAKALGDRRLGATARNWNTVTNLLALASS